MTGHAKLYRVHKDGHKEHVGEIHGGFIQFLPALAGILGPAVGELLSGLTSKIFGKGNYHMEHGGEHYMLPKTKTHMHHGKGILDILGKIFRGLTGGRTGGVMESEECGAIHNVGCGAKKGRASFGGRTEGGTRRGRASFGEGGSLNGTDEHPMKMHNGSKTRKLTGSASFGGLVPEMNVEGPSAMSARTTYGSASGARGRTIKKKRWNVTLSRGECDDIRSLNRASSKKSIIGGRALGPAEQHAQNWERLSTRRHGTYRHIPTSVNYPLSDSDIVRLSKGTVNVMNSRNFPLLETSKQAYARLSRKTVLNLDNKGQGTHWTAIASEKRDPSVLHYSDSFGIPPPFKLKDKLILFNPFQYQRPDEVNCGARALNFLKKVSL